jgi:FAD/FMN-containing dehydrogenase
MPGSQSAADAEADTQQLQPARAPRRWQNWSHTFSAELKVLFTPCSRQELQAIVTAAARARKPLKVLGSGHSLSAVALPLEQSWAVSLERYGRILSVDRQQRSVRVEGGAVLTDINCELRRHGLAFANLGSISLQTAGGIIQTGTHGTGATFAAFHSQVLEMTVVDGTGRLLSLSEQQQPELFHACLCGLGVMGIVDTLTIRVVPSFRLEERTEGRSWADTLPQLQRLAAAHHRIKLLYFPFTDHVGLWTAAEVNQDQQQQPPSPLPQQFGGDDAHSVKTVPIHPADVSRANAALFAASFAHPSTRTADSVSIFNMDCGPPGQLFAIEAAVPLSSAIRFLTHWTARVNNSYFPAYGPLEIRFVHSDNRGWLSPTYGDDESQIFCYAGVNVLRPGGQPVSVDEYFNAFIECVEKFNGRLHWGKQGHHSSEYLQRQYPRWANFNRLRQQHDPHSLWLNELTKEWFSAGSAAVSNKSRL